MPHNSSLTMLNGNTVADSDLLKRINEVLAANELRLVPVKGDAGVAAGYEFVYGSRSFHLRVGLAELACALGVMTSPVEAEPAPLPSKVSSGRRYGHQGR